MVRALSMGGGWYFHSGKVPRAAIWPELADTQPHTALAPAQQEPAAINSEALHTGQEVAHV
ncbi:hypothetical protein [Acidovorax delafieldii]|uniref:hypothetical protein n=1 Tax=Acidovorax delafieldii TaxID=47920 RepID=UPI003ED0AB14